jgi:copper homeostasis protein
MVFELEICVNSIQSALAAQQGGATRIELCDNMAEGGTTPSAGMISLCKKMLNIPVFPIIRPRGGDFLYSDVEYEVMKQDVVFCRKSGCEGVVLGILKPDGAIDTARCAELIALARPMQVTFHRAFDRCNDLDKGLQAIISLGCERLLTSGGELTAPEGVEQLARLVSQASGRINIMPGSGVNEHNIAILALKTGAGQFHSTAKEIITSAMQFKGTGKLFGADGDFSIMQTSAAKVRMMKEALAQSSTPFK